MLLENGSKLSFEVGELNPMINRVDGSCLFCSSSSWATKSFSSECPTSTLKWNARFTNYVVATRLNGSPLSTPLTRRKNANRISSSGRTISNKSNSCHKRSDCSSSILFRVWFLWVQAGHCSPLFSINKQTQRNLKTKLNEKKKFKITNKSTWNKK